MRTIGAVIFEGFEMLDYFGPLQMFKNFPEDFRILAVSETMAPVRCSGGPEVVPDRCFADGAEYDLLLVPGGMGTRKEAGNTAMLSWLRQAAGHAGIVMSVCTGSALLARAGVLDGLPATSNKRAFDWVRSQSDKVDWQERARWVEAGKVFTSSGVSAGLDMSLAVLARLLGREAAGNAALWAEYLPNLDPDNDPFSLSGET
ncbi:DJ-1/PfpI family protein [Leisingera sp. ANG-Vp]|uniref:DJ-1/PfpI family protein n=1 Tax=Leisingera sp. ANG-Vp TaxID=1577896 RepID=UPI00057F2751|nr:DJ-1/PfpI family protein [Leisingera sp. ANG-Vp]KIC13678.1 dimethyladenosine transferase [Leisingera sp. ANG-Vp]